MLTLSAPIHVWVASAVAMFLAGKLLQQGGVQFGRGEFWQANTLLGTVIEIGLVFAAIVSLVTQNA